MDAEEFRRRGREMIDYVADYLENIRSRRVLPEVTPGYMRALIPDHAPETPDKWEDLFKDIERVIMPGVTHWHSPQFHAYYPTGNSYPAIVADILSDAIGCIGFTWVTHWQSPNFHAYYPAQCTYTGLIAAILSGGLGVIGFTWASSPACTELEVITMDWLGKMLDLPAEFLASSGGKGGGVIQSTASEATVVALLSARARAIHAVKKDNPDMEDGVILSKFVAYTSDQSHSSVERAGLIALVRMRSLETDGELALRGVTLQAAIDRDRAAGLVPIFVCATLGTTSSCAFDNTLELGEVCRKESVWMHIDAAYAGSAFICHEFRHLLNGVEYAESFNFNPHKWMKVNFDCSTMWVRDSRLISGAFEVDPIYLKHEQQGNIMPDYRHWHIPLGRRFRSLKLWFVLRLYGQTGLQECIRHDVGLAHEFEGLVQTDSRFEIVGKVVMGLVCFRLKGDDSANERLLKSINADGRIHLVPSVCKGVYFLRFAICSAQTISADVQFAWKVVQELADQQLTS